MDPRFQGILCLEEPENGIHPARIPAMIELLRDIATDTNESVSTDNPLRQVIINTHSPAVVAQSPDDSVLMAEPISQVAEDKTRFTSLAFRCLANTWRADLTNSKPVSLGNVLSYLSPLERHSLPQLPKGVQSAKASHRVIDRSDVQGSLFGEARA
jgi:hypothetical protein